MDDNISIEKKYLFQLDLVEDNVSVVEYISKILKYENANRCHITNKNFHDKATQQKVLGGAYAGKLDVTK